MIVLWILYLSSLFEPPESRSFFNKQLLDNSSQLENEPHDQFSEEVAHQFFSDTYTLPPPFPQWIPSSPIPMAELKSGEITISEVLSNPWPDLLHD